MLLPLLSRTSKNNGILRREIFINYTLSFIFHKKDTNLYFITKRKGDLLFDAYISSRHMPSKDNSTGHIKNKRKEEVARKSGVKKY